MLNYFLARSHTPLFFPPHLLCRPEPLSVGQWRSDACSFKVGSPQHQHLQKLCKMPIAWHWNVVVGLSAVAEEEDWKGGKEVQKRKARVALVLELELAAARP